MLDAASNDATCVRHAYRRIPHAIELAEVDMRFKPCYIKKKDTHNGAYKRVDDKDVKLSATEIFELQNALYPSTADRETVDDATIDDLDFAIVDALIAGERQRGAKSLRGANTRESQMSRLNITDNNEMYRISEVAKTTPVVDEKRRGNPFRAVARNAIEYARDRKRNRQKDYNIAGRDEKASG